MTSQKFRMVDRASTYRERNRRAHGKNEALGRRLEKLRRDFGPVFIASPRSTIPTDRDLAEADGTPVSGKARLTDGTDRSDEHNVCRSKRTIANAPPASSIER
jgi:hypothetical protein